MSWIKQYKQSRDKQKEQNSRYLINENSTAMLNTTAVLRIQELEFEQYLIEMQRKAEIVTPRLYNRYK